MAIKFIPVAVDEEGIKLIQNCKDEFVSINPSFRDVTLSRNKILKEVMRFYLKQ